MRVEKPLASNCVIGAAPLRAGQQRGPGAARRRCRSGVTRPEAGDGDPAPRPRHRGASRSRTRRARLAMRLPRRATAARSPSRRPRRATARAASSSDCPGGMNERTFTSRSRESSREARRRRGRQRPPASSSASAASGVEQQRRGEHRTAGEMVREERGALRHLQGRLHQAARTRARWSTAPGRACRRSARRGAPAAAEQGRSRSRTACGSSNSASGSIGPEAMLELAHGNARPRWREPRVGHGVCVQLSMSTSRSSVSPGATVAQDSASGERRHRACCGNPPRPSRPTPPAGRRPRRPASAGNAASAAGTSVVSRARAGRARPG